MIGGSDRLDRGSPARVVAVGAVVVLVGLSVATKAGVIEMPDPESTLLAVGPTLGQWTYLLVGVLAFLETSTFLGLALPGEVSIALGGVVAGQGTIRLEILIPLVWAAVVAGDVTAYWLGRRLGRDFILRRGSRFGITPSRLAWTERYFEAHGGKTILIGRFLSFMRTLAPFLAGASKMHFKRFLLFDAVGAALWVATFALLGWIFWQSLDDALELAGWGKLVLLAAVALVVGAVALRAVLGSPGWRSRVRSGRAHTDD